MGNASSAPNSTREDDPPVRDLPNTPPSKKQQQQQPAPHPSSSISIPQRVIKEEVVVGSVLSASEYTNETVFQNMPSYDEPSYENSARILHSSGIRPLARLDAVAGKKRVSRTVLFVPVCLALCPVGFECMCIDGRGPIPIMVSWTDGGDQVYCQGSFNEWKSIRLSKRYHPSIPNRTISTCSTIS